MEPPVSPTLSPGEPRKHSNGDSSAFENVPRAPDIPVYAVIAAYGEDRSPAKLNLSFGVYRTERQCPLLSKWMPHELFSGYSVLVKPQDGKPHVMNVVKQAEQLLLDDLSSSKEYLPITGLSQFNKLSAELLFGADSLAIRESRVSTVQSLSGSGSLRIGAEFLAKHYHQRIIYLSQPTYGNHPNFFLATGFALKSYRYYEPTRRGLDFPGLLEDLGSAAPGAVVLLQACSHNPTGIDPTLEQWEQIRQLMRSKGLLPFFDCAYQGFVSGNMSMDAQSVRMFVADGGECLVAQSYSKIMGLYGERVGALNIVCKTADLASRVESQLKLVIRPMYSNPPIHGAAIATVILKDREMYNNWTTELGQMIDRIIDLRQKLYDGLHERGTPGDWSHILRQVGMYFFSGLSAEQVAFMAKEYHIYMSPDGRINMAGLSANTASHLADAMHAAVTRIAH